MVSRKDERTYIRLHDGMPDHPKIVGLSDAAFRLYIEALCWCSRHLTDGRIPPAALRKLGAVKTARELEAAGLLLAAGGGHWEVHDYLRHQRSAAEVEELREKRRAAGSKGGKAKANATANARTVAKQNGAIDRDIVRDRSKSVDKSGGDRPVTLRAPGDTEPPGCSKHPDGNSDDACHGCRRVREWHEGFAARVAAEYEQRRASCQRCGGSGLIESVDPEGRAEPVAKCDHRPLLHSVD